MRTAHLILFDPKNAATSKTAMHLLHDLGEQGRMA
jgi:hypothetical protein